MERSPLSVLVTTRNEAHNLPECLSSVRWAEDVLVVDSGSTDATGEIARRAGARVIVHEYESAARQKNWALPHLRHPWILILDADERLSPALASEIQAVLRHDGPLDGYFLSRRSTFLGRTIRYCGWDRDRVLRLFRAGKGQYDDRMVHETLELDGRSGTLQSPLLHHPVRSFSEYLEKLDRYTARGATDLQRRGMRPSVWRLLVHPPARFLRMYVLQRGFLDGVHGFLLCSLAAGSVWLKYARLFETPPAPVRPAVESEAEAASHRADPAHEGARS